MSQKILGTIKFSDKKIITKKDMVTYTLVETWEQTESNKATQYLIHNCIRYELISKTEKPIKTS